MASTTPTTTTTRTSRRWSREWLSVGRRLSRNDQENNFPKSPMQPSHLNSIPTTADSGAHSPLPMPERAISNGTPVPARLAIPRPSSEMIAAEIRRVTTPLEMRRGSDSSSNQQTSASTYSSPSNSTSSTLSQELEKMKTGKVWWWQRDDVLKARMSSVIVAGLFLTVCLAIYLSLILTNNLRTQQTHVLVIMLLVLVGVFFCHTLARLCIAVLRPQPIPEMTRNVTDLEAQTGVPFVRGPGGYAIPAEPIPVTFPDKQTATTVPPPAYGLWRHSVRVNPDQFYWVRRESQPSSDEEEAAAAENGNVPPPPLTPLSIAPPTTAEGEGVSRRPPSYISEDGVSYVLAAARQSRTIAARRSSAASNLSIDTFRTAPSPPQPQAPIEVRSSIDARRFRPTHPSSSPRASLESARRPRGLDISPPRGSMDSRRLV